MYRIIDGRGTGKTSRLFLIAKENNAVIICRNPEAMRQKAYAYGITGLDFMSYEDSLEIPYAGQSAVVIDELESYIKYFLHENVGLIGYTLSNED